MRWGTDRMVNCNSRTAHVQGVLTMMISFFLILAVVSFAGAQIDETERIRGDDEPRLVNSHLLEGVTEPFEIPEVSMIPLWKLMKNSADKKASEQLIQSALAEYGQLIRSPDTFGKMPTEEKYDVFLSMSKLLKVMGFDQRAELLLYEAMSYSREPHEAHYQLGLLMLDKEDMDRAKMHLKNCLFYRESDTLILIYLSTILLTEGKVHEAKFYVSRIVSSLDHKLHKLSQILDKGDLKLTKSKQHIDHIMLRNRLEDMIVKVYRGEFIFIPSATLELHDFFQNLIDWISRGEMAGRFVFDLGQSLYERGRPLIGREMMARGFSTSDAKLEGVVSVQVVSLRLAMEYPVVPDSMLHIIEAYLNITQYLGQSTGSEDVPKIELENMIDVFWPLPLLWWSALPVAPVLQELIVNYFYKEPVRNDYAASLWLRRHLHCDALPASLPEKEVPVEIGILGGHLNGHAVGQFLLHRLLRNLNSRKQFRITLIALPLIPDAVTPKIAALADRIVNLPADTGRAWLLLEKLDLDVLLFPDWQPFPDQQSVLFQSTRIAPIQICVYTRGSSCSSTTVDYYLLPSDAQGAHLEATRYPAQPALLEQWMEQVVLVDWPVFTPSAITNIADMAIEATPPRDSKKAHLSGGVRSKDDLMQLDDEPDTSFTPTEEEGRVFFDNQAVALIPLDPCYVHPLMDEAIFALLRSVPHMQVVIVLPEVYAHVLPSSSPESRSLSEYDTPLKRLSVEWAKKLARRLWDNGGSLHQRIRFLPSPMSDSRLLQLMRQADVVLDSFPMGASLHPLGLALAVGTPVVTMRAGVLLRSSPSQATELRKSLQHSNNRYSSNLAHKIVATMGSPPWSPCISPLGAFYDRIGLGNELVADSVAEYVAIAERIGMDRDKAYDLRVRISDAIDGEDLNDWGWGVGETASGVGNDSRRGSGTGRVKVEGVQQMSAVDESMREIEEFLVRVGKPWAKVRYKRRGRKC